MNVRMKRMSVICYDTVSSILLGSFKSHPGSSHPGPVRPPALSKHNVPFYVMWICSTNKKYKNLISIFGNRYWYNGHFILECPYMAIKIIVYFVLLIDYSWCINFRAKIHTGPSVRVMNEIRLFTNWDQNIRLSISLEAAACHESVNGCL